MEDEICLYQFLDRKAPRDNGNCEICTIDEYNRNCINYEPIKITRIDIFDRVEYFLRP